MRTAIVLVGAVLVGLAVAVVQAADGAPAAQATEHGVAVIETEDVQPPARPDANPASRIGRLDAGAADAGERLASGPDFAVAVPGGAMTAAQGTRAATVVSTTVSGGFSAVITLSVTGLPAGVTATFVPATIAAPGAGSATLTLVADAAAPVGVYTLTIRGTGAATIRSATVSFTVASSMVTIFSDGFEGAFPGTDWHVRHSGANAWWGSSTYRAYAGTHSVYCAGSGSQAAPAGGPYPANMSGWMAYGPFSLVGAIAAEATFKYWLKSQTDHDKFQFMMSLDGVHWNGFTRTGSPSGWQSATFNFGDVLLPTSGLGQPVVYFGFIFESDGATQLEGAYVDALTITKTAVGTSCVVTCSASSPAWGAPATPVQFTGAMNAASCSGSPTITWNFADGPPQSTVPSPAHSYASTGAYAWQMTAAMGGQTCVRNGNVTISSCSLGCDATVPATAVTGAAVSFTGQVTAPGCVSTPTVAWTFGDGAGSAALSPTHTYASVGVYPWQMTVTADGRTCVKNGSIAVAAPVCTLSCNATVPAAWTTTSPVQFHATATASYCGGSPAYSWAFGDGGHAATADAAHTYATLGPRTWTLTVTAGAETCVKSGTVAIQQPVHRRLQGPH